MDVHTTSYTLCCYSMESDSIFAMVKIEPDYHNILRYLERVRKNYSEKCKFLCGYEAGALGYTLYHQLTNKGIECVIMAPSTMQKTNKKEVKTDKRDAIKIAKGLAYNSYKAVYILDDEDNAVREYIRMRDDHNSTLKRTKQRISAFCNRHGRNYTEGSKWTQKHLRWLEKQDFGSPTLQETLKEYLILYYQAQSKLELFKQRIEEFANQERYQEKVSKLRCFVGIDTHTALALIVETGDFIRFKKAQHYAAYLGLAPGENSSGSTIKRTEITKAGNSHMRRLLIESAHSYQRGTQGKKSKRLTNRQFGNNSSVIAYADKACERLRRKYWRIVLRTQKKNTAVTAVARELACFVWGMMTDNISQV